MPTTPCLSQKPENCCCYGRVSRLWTLKTPVFMARKRWRHDVTMSSENSQGYLWIPCEFYSSLANQIMCNKQSALEYHFQTSYVKLLMKEKEPYWFWVTVSKVKFGTVHKILKIVDERRKKLYWFWVILSKVKGTRTNPWKICPLSKLFSIV